MALSYCNRQLPDRYEKYYITFSIDHMVKDFTKQFHWQIFDCSTLRNTPKRSKTGSGLGLRGLGAVSS